MQSRSNEGTAPGPRTTDAPRQSGAAASSAVPRGLTVLLVEADGLIRLSTVEMLEEIGCRVVATSGVEHALGAFDREAVDLLLAEVTLPDGSGLELARRLRGTRPSLPVVFTTGHSEIDGLKEAGLEGSSLMLDKPYECAELSACLERATGPATAAARGGGRPITDHAS